MKNFLFCLILGHIYSNVLLPISFFFIFLLKWKISFLIWILLPFWGVKIFFLDWISFFWKKIIYYFRNKNLEILLFSIYKGTVLKNLIFVVVKSSLLWWIVSLKIFLLKGKFSFLWEIEYFFLRKSSFIWWIISLLS